MILCAAAARTSGFEPSPSPARMTTIPATSDRPRCSGLLINISENAARVNQETGDESGGAAPADGRARRAALLTTELAEDCATKMFTERADGPHALNIDLVAICPTVEEIAIGQKAVAAALGEKGSEKRAHANRPH